MKQSARRRMPLTGALLSAFLVSGCATYYYPEPHQHGEETVVYVEPADQTYATPVREEGYQRSYYESYRAPVTHYPYYPGRYDSFWSVDSFYFGPGRYAPYTYSPWGYAGWTWPGFRYSSRPGYFIGLGYYPSWAWYQPWYRPGYSYYAGYYGYYSPWRYPRYGYRGGYRGHDRDRGYDGHGGRGGDHGGRGGRGRDDDSRGGRGGQYDNRGGDRDQVEAIAGRLSGVDRQAISQPQVRGSNASRKPRTRPGINGGAVTDTSGKPVVISRSPGYRGRSDLKPSNRQPRINLPAQPELQPRVVSRPAPPSAGRSDREPQKLAPIRGQLDSNRPEPRELRIRDSRVKTPQQSRKPRLSAPAVTSQPSRPVVRSQPAPVSRSGGSRAGDDGRRSGSSRNSGSSAVSSSRIQSSPRGGNDDRGMARSAGRSKGGSNSRRSNNPR